MLMQKRRSGFTCLVLSIFVLASCSKDIQKEEEVDVEGYTEVVNITDETRKAIPPPDGSFDTMSENTYEREWCAPSFTLIRKSTNLNARTVTVRNPSTPGSCKSYSVQKQHLVNGTWQTVPYSVTTIRPGETKVFQNNCRLGVGVLIWGFSPASDPIVKYSATCSTNAQ